MSDRPPDDSILLQRAIQRDSRAIMILYERYHNLVYSLAFRIVQNTMLADEVTQDTFVDLWLRPETWDSSKGQFSSWLLTITHHKAIDRLRKENRHALRQINLPDDTLNPAKSTLTSSDPQWESGQILHALLLKLPQHEAQLIDLAFFQGMSHSQLATLLNLPLGTVKTRLRSGLKKLRALWSEIIDSEK